MVSRIPPPQDGPDGRGGPGGPAGRQPRRPATVLAVLLVAALAIGGWVLAGGGAEPTSVVADDTGVSAPRATGPSASAEEDPDSSGATITEPDEPDEPEEPQEPDEAQEPPSVDPGSGLPTVYLLDLPPEAAATVEAIQRGPPYAYEKDGSTFGNYEGLLPDRERGHYQEFTVETPGSYDRGARRIVEGADGELYWTDDHYASFSLILL